MSSEELCILASWCFESDEQEFSFRRVESKKISNYPGRYLSKSVLKVENAGIKVEWVEREEDITECHMNTELGVTSVQVDLKTRSSNSVTIYNNRIVSLFDQGRGLRGLTVGRARERAGLTRGRAARERRARAGGGGQARSAFWLVILKHKTAIIIVTVFQNLSLGVWPSDPAQGV